MAYNPYNDINAIYNLKGQWNSANAAGDDAKKNEAAQKAQAYYKALENNGYADVAKQLRNSDYTAAKQTRDTYAKTGKNAIRPYLYDSKLKNTYGLSNAQIDDIISFDGTTGEVSLGGKNIGKPYSIVDGVSYWDSETLDSAIDDYIARSGITAADSNMAAKNTAEANSKTNQLWGLQQSDHSDLTNMYKEEYENIKNTNPFETEEAKAILGKYDLSALQERDNAVATGGASNGGNIDSYAAANAMRQQASLINQGQMAVLDAHQQKLDNARAILEGLGVYQQNSYSSMQNTISQQQNDAQRLFDNDQTAKNNDVARKATIAEVTGYSPDEWIVSDNPYLDDDGTIKDEYKDIDFSAVMANAKANGNTNLYNAAATARFYKIMGDYGLYGQYDDGNYNVPEKQKSESARQFDEQTAAADRALGVEERMNADNNSTVLATALANAYGNSQTKGTENVENVVDLAYDPNQLGEGNAYGIDEYGKKLLERLANYAATAYGGGNTLLTDEELLEQAVAFSAECQTNKNQISNVLDFLGVKISLDDIEDRDPKDWTKGVKWIND